MGDAHLEELWADVLARWDQPKAHDAFLEHCRVTQQLDVAAKLYRAEAERGAPYRDDASRVGDAQKRLKTVTTLAMLELERSRAESALRGGSLTATRWAIRLTVLGLLLAGLLSFAARHL